MFRLFDTHSWTKTFPKARGASSSSCGRSGDEVLVAAFGEQPVEGARGSGARVAATGTEDGSRRAH